MDTKTQQQYAETFHGLHKRGDPPRRTTKRSARYLRG
jgi:hypothetical protein